MEKLLEKILLDDRYWNSNRIDTTLSELLVKVITYGGKSLRFIYYIIIIWCTDLTKFIAQIDFVYYVSTHFVKTVK